ncbi:nicotinamidase [Rhodotorula toruloides]|uniref:nicotinamidase n=1 Tax=Rhodotorula toruloides TaxID=5286 RepID=A0A511KGI3_RHOTO|nr:nicotinamidase [Rhodotorula toruloides]
MPSRPCPALLLVDLQHDFLPPSGALAVPHGDAVLEDAVYPLLDRGKWNLDFHPPGHISFASRHQLPTFSRTTVSHPLTQEPIDQELWPNHCVQGTRGCEFDEGVEQRLERLRTERGEQFVRVIQKGVDRDLDAYSAFAVPLAVPGASSRSADPSEGGATSAELTRVLLDSGITHLVIVGLALDFCVLASALAAKRASAAHGDRWEVWVVREGTRAVSADKEEAVFERMRSEGIKVVNMKDDELRQWTRDSE